MKVGWNINNRDWYCLLQWKITITSGYAFIEEKAKIGVENNWRNYTGNIKKLKKIMKKEAG